jgi:hypothetical protein
VIVSYALFDVHAVARCTSWRDAKRRDSKQTSSMSHAIVCPDGKARSENTVRVSAETASAGPIRLAITLEAVHAVPEQHAPARLVNDDTSRRGSREVRGRLIDRQADHLADGAPAQHVHDREHPRLGIERQRHRHLVRLLGGCDDGLGVLERRGQWLFDEHVLAGPQSGDGEGCVGRMRRRDDDRVDVTVIRDRVEVGRPPAAPWAAAKAWAVSA